MSTQSDPDGGYLVPETVDAAIGQIAANLSPMRRVCNVVVAGERYSKLMNMQGETATWGGETTAPTETQGMKLAELTYPTGVLQAMPKVTNNLLDDASVDVADELSTGIARAFSASEGLAFLKGDGINKPRGLMTYNTVENASYAWNSIGYIKSGDTDGFVDASATVSPSDALVGVVYGLQAEYRANASWMMNSDTARIARLWKDTIGRPIWTDSIAPGQPPLLLGYPVIFNEDMDSVAANKFPIAFGDFSRAYLIHDLPQGIRILPDPYSFKPYTAFYTTKRVGGGILDFGAVKLLKIAS
jgi:HK97 family phage major capsid protein